jgi:hypothetical protein
MSWRVGVVVTPDAVGGGVRDDDTDDDNTDGC